MYGKSVIRETSVALVLVAALSGLVGASLSDQPVDGARWQDPATQRSLPMLPEIVVTATRLEA